MAFWEHQIILHLSLRLIFSAWLSPIVLFEPLIARYLFMLTVKNVALNYIYIDPMCINWIVETEPSPMFLHIPLEISWEIKDFVTFSNSFKNNMEHHEVRISWIYKMYQLFPLYVLSVFTYAV